MKVNIVCTDEGWIYSKFIDMFRKYSKHEIVLNEKGDVNHFLPYYEFNSTFSEPCTAWMSHMEERKDLRNKFINAAKNVDIPISHSKKYADVLKRDYGISRVQQIIPGVDLNVFKQRGTDRPDNDKLVVGYIGRQYTSSDRKNPSVLKQISELDFVDFRVTGGNVKEEHIPSFYAGLDIVVSPATIEGGPMSIQEALAVGVPILCFSGVGVTDEFAHGLIKVPFNKNKDFVSRLDIIWRTKSYLEWRKKERMNEMRKQVKYQSWERFVRRHDKVWELL